MGKLKGLTFVEKEQELTQVLTLSTPHKSEPRILDAQVALGAKGVEGMATWLATIITEYTGHDESSDRTKLPSGRSYYWLGAVVQIGTSQKEKVNTSNPSTTDVPTHWIDPSLPWQSPPLQITIAPYGGYFPTNLGR